MGGNGQQDKVPWCWGRGEQRQSLTEENFNYK